MFALRIISIIAAIAIVSAAPSAEQLDTGCYVSGSGIQDNAACTSFVNDFCNSITSDTYRPHDSSTRCYTVNRHRCDFSVGNTGDVKYYPLSDRCKAVLNRVTKDCPEGGEGKYTKTTAFVFSAVPNEGTCV